MTDSPNRRQFLTATAALGAAGVLPAARAGDQPNGRIALPALTHSVFFWLKRPESAEDRQALIEGLKTLEAIDTVRGLHIGVPASTEQRDVVDNSYDVSELMLFDSAADEEAYQVDPIHQQFVADCSHLWRKVVVYDSLAV